MMRVTYDRQAKAIYVYVAESLGFGMPINSSAEIVQDAIAIDLGRNGELIGIEILDVELEDITNEQ